MVFQYPALEDDAKMFRIMILAPGSGEAPLKCELINRHVKPADRREQEYEALSWTWGLDAINETEMLHIGRELLPIKPNLVKALRALRYESSSRALWVDAVCINQDSKHEKDVQVAMMSIIYGQATSVCVWLGDASNDSDSAMEFIEDRIADLPTFDKLVESKETLARWRALQALMTRPWFERRWVVQEIALARRATLHCGSKQISWTSFATAVALFEKEEPKIAKLIRGSEAHGYSANFFGHVQAMGAIRLVEATANLFRRSEDGTIVERRFTLEELVFNLWTFQAKEPHDMIYAILALAKDAHMKTSAKPIISRSRTNSCNAATPVAQSSEVILEETTAARSNTRTRETYLSSTDQEASTRKRQRDPLEDGGKRFCSTSAHQHDPPTAKRGRPGSQYNGAISERNKGLAGKVLNQLKQITHPENVRVFNVKYEQLFFDLCKQFLRFTLPKSQSLDFLCRPWAPEPVPKQGQDEIHRDDVLPSWIPTLKGAAFGAINSWSSTDVIKMSRKNADPLVGQSGLDKSHYRASGGHKARWGEDWRLGEDESPTARSLFVSGFVFDVIGQATDKSQSGVIPKEWLEMGKWKAGKDPPEPLWRTLVADRAENG
ncbi:hypothetical protein LTS18_009430, partial [Coniosporium uncinatum]